MKKQDAQAVLDGEEAVDRLAALRRAIQRRDAAAQGVSTARAVLMQARRRLKEAEWDLTVALGEERRKNGHTGGDDGKKEAQV